MTLPISLVGLSTAGGVIKGPGAPNVKVNGLPISLVGDEVAPHGPGLHQGPVMVEGSPHFRINGVPVVRTGNRASCGHEADGFPSVRITL